MIGVILVAMFLWPFLGVCNDILGIMVPRHRPTMWIIYIGIRVPKLVDLGSEVDIWWTKRLFRFLIIFKFVYATYVLHDALGFPISYQKIDNMNQNIFPVPLSFR